MCIFIKFSVTVAGISGDKEKAKWDKMWQLYLDETNPQELSKLRTALGYAKDPQLLKRFYIYSFIL